MNYREANIERAIEIFAVAKVIDRKVKMRIVNMPEIYTDFNTYHINGKPGPMTAVVEYPPNYHPSKASTSCNMEPVENVIERINRGRDIAKSIFKDNYDNLDKMISAKPGSERMLRVATDRLNLSADSVYCIKVVAWTIAILAGTPTQIQVEHVAEAIMYYSMLNYLSPEQITIRNIEQRLAEMKVYVEDERIKKDIDYLITEVNEIIKF